MVERNTEIKIVILLMVLWIGTVSCTTGTCPLKTAHPSTKNRTQKSSTSDCELEKRATRNSYKLLVIEHILLHICHTGLIFTASEYFSQDHPEVTDILARGHLACQDAIFRWKNVSPSYPSTWKEIADKIFESSENNQNLTNIDSKSLPVEEITSNVIGYYCAYGAGLVTTIIESRGVAIDKVIARERSEKAMMRCRYQIAFQGIVDLIDNVVIETN